MTAPSWDGRDRLSIMSKIGRVTRGDASWQRVASDGSLFGNWCHACETLRCYLCVIVSKHYMVSIVSGKRHSTDDQTIRFQTKLKHQPSPAVTRHSPPVWQESRTTSWPESSHLIHTRVVCICTLWALSCFSTPMPSNFLTQPRAGFNRGRNGWSQSNEVGRGGAGG